MSVLTSHNYREAFRLHALGEPLSEAQARVLEAGREEARFPGGRYPLPCGAAHTPRTEEPSEVAVTRLDAPRSGRLPRLSRHSPWAEEER